MIIGIIGKARSGKDTSGDYLVSTKNFKKYSFANPLKRGAMEIFGFTEDQVFGETKDVVDSVWGVTPRLVLQVMGTELFQYDIQKHIPAFAPIGRGIWVKRFKQWYEVNRAVDETLNVVICDVRFQHEADAILALGGQVWKVQRPSLSSTDEHASEMEMNNIQGVTHIITNDGTLEDLYNKVDSLVEVVASN